MNHAAIGLGSNIEAELNIEAAMARIGNRHRVIAASKIVKTPPVGFPDQPDFLNGVLLVETDMKFEDLQEWLHGIEDDLGRIRTAEKYGPRTIDLDIVAWNGRVVDADVYERDFLRAGLQEVWPELKI